jgi:hypothetical protein
MLSWIRKTITRSPRTHCQRPVHRRARLSLELLEGRVVPSTFSVTSLADSGTGSLRPAVLSADTDPSTGTDTITFTGNGASGTILLESVLPRLGHNLTILGPGADKVTIQRDVHASAFSLFQVTSRTAVTIAGLTLSGGDAGASNGGAVVNDGTLTLTSCTLSGNQAASGGGVENDSQKTLAVADCTFSNNVVAVFGGGIDNRGGTATVTDCTFSGNHSTFLGGGIFNSGTLTVSASTFSGNLADDDGGGLETGGAVGAAATVTACTFSTNVADNGGKGGSGGGIHVQSGTLTLDSTLVAGNSNNGTTGDDIAGSVASTSSFNLVGNGTGLRGISNNDINHNQVGTISSPIDPKLGALQNNGGPTQTMAPTSGSPAIGAGDPSLTGIDQVGNSRAFDGRVDVGAVEVEATALQAVGITELPANVFEGAALTVGAALQDIDPNDVLTYQWQVTVHNTSTVIASGSAASLTFTPTQLGVDDITLTVSNAFAETAVKGVSPTVLDVAPAVDLGGTDATLTGMTLSRGGSFTDLGSETWTGVVNYGDGSSTQTLALNADKTFSLSHTYAKGGNYTVEVEVSDGVKKGLASLTLTVPAPLQGVQITGLPPGRASPEGTLLTLGSDVSDLDPQDAQLKYAWQVTANGTTVASGSTSSLTFTPAVPGSYDVQLTVTDQFGDTVSDEQVVTASNVPPSVSLDSIATHFLSISGTGSFTDPGVETWTATVDYGDGSGARPLTLGPDNTFTLSHDYAEGGNYTVTVDVFDGIDHGSDALTVPVPSALQEMLSEPEDTATPANVKIADLLAGHVSDPDANAKLGIAVTGTTGNGQWQYSSGGGWTAIPAASLSHALLMPASDLLRFLPAKVWNGEAHLLYLVWDGSQGTAGHTLAITEQGGAAPVSSDAGIVSVIVTPVNHAPTWSAASTTLTAELPGTTDPAGESVHQAFGGLFRDGDNNPVGIAISGASGNGAWQYSADGADWTPIGNVSASAALLLSGMLPSSADRESSLTGVLLRFVPAGNATGTATLQVHPWDGTTGSTGDTVNLTTRNATGGATAFGTSVLTANLAITPNRAPTWSLTAVTLTTPGDPSGLLVLPSQASNPVGLTVASVFGAAFHDADVNPPGIAIVGATGSAGGAWQYSRDGVQWAALGNVSAGGALLLAGSDLVRFVPNAGFVGAVALQVRVWDGTTGSAGSTVDLSGPGAIGGSTAFSSATLTATGLVNALNVAPTWSASTLTLPAVLPGSAPAGMTVATLFGGLFHDLDGNPAGIAVTSQTATARQGHWQYSTDGMTWTNLDGASTSNAVLLAGTDLLRFLPAATFTAASLQALAWDGTQGQPGGTMNLSARNASGDTTAFSSAALTVQTTAAAPGPSWTATSAALAAVLPAATGSDREATPVGQTVAEIFGPYFQDAATGTSAGIAVSGLTGKSLQGNWQYQLDGTTTWQSIGAVPTKQALLLSGGARLRFIPSSGFLGTVSLTAYAWDGSTGQAGALAKVSGTAFSRTPLTATCLVNTAPSVTG